MPTFSDEERSLGRCPHCGLKQEKIPALSGDPDFRDPPEGAVACKCQNPKCKRIFFSSERS